MRRLVRAAAGLLLSFAMLGALPATPAPTAGADAPNMTSGFGITVGGWRWISGRTLEVDISSAKVGANAVIGPHRVRITLPNDYFQSGTTRYPVLYLLHGGAGGNSAQWTTGGGAVEPLTDGKRLITVMPDGGKVGWYTNWVSPGSTAQTWRDFHIDQLIPWVDANLRTIASKSGRAIAGLSMGGFGAVRYAQDRPDLFAFVGSFSGAVDLGDSGTRSVVTEQATQYGFNPYGPFGNPFWPFDGTWNALNPLNRASRLQGVSVALYAGGGINDQDVLEGTMRASADRFSAALNNAGVPHFYWMYGRPGPGSPFGCDGGHNFGCWNFALLDALPRMLAVLQQPGSPPPPPPSNPVVNGGFESGMAPWTCLGQCGRDGGGFARSGVGNGWVRNTSGWNDLHQTISVAANRTYRVTAWVRTSANNTAGYVGLRTLGGQVVGERGYGNLPGYTLLSVDVATGASTSLVLYAGLWANGDTWAQVDDVSVTLL
jgi:S-formylglutathione hydrolase FrmB